MQNPIQLNPAAHETLALFTPFLSKECTREVLQKVAIQDKHLYATDGHRLLRTPLKGLLPAKPVAADGAYDLLKVGKEYILRPAPEFQPPTFKVVVENAIKPHADRFTFEWTNDPKQNDLRKRSQLSFSLASWGICLDFEQIKALPLNLVYTVSGIKDNLGSITFDTVREGAHKSQRDFFALIATFRITEAPRYTGLTKEEALFEDLKSFVQGYRHAQFLPADKDRLKALASLDNLTKDLARRIEGRA